MKLLPESVLVTHGNFIETFTSFDESTRIFTLAAADYPSVSSATFWEYRVSEDISSLTAVSEAVVISYPVSSSPAPLNIAPLKMVRILNAGVDATHLAMFSNGEIHVLDIASRQFKQIARIASDEALLSTAYPRSTWSHAYDPDTHSVWSVVFAASNAYAVSTNLATGLVSDYVPLTIAAESPGDGFSSQTFINAHMVKYLDDEAPRFTTVMMSLENVGFDQINFVNTATGVMEDEPQANMMEDAVFFQCSGLMCDSQRTSVYDAQNKRIIFQAHIQASDDVGTALYAYQYDVNVNGKGYFYKYDLITTGEYPMWGMSGFQLVNYVL